MSSYAATHFIETLTTLIDERVQLALDSRSTKADSNGSKGWLSTNEAAEYIAAPRSRIYDLVALGVLVPCRDGTRLRFTREQLDAYVRDGGGRAE